jgi:hypothetical protein
MNHKIGTETYRCPFCLTSTGLSSCKECGQSECDVCGFGELSEYCVPTY